MVEQVETSSDAAASSEPLSPYGTLIHSRVSLSDLARSAGTRDYPGTYPVQAGGA